MPLIWTYMYTTAENPLMAEDRSDFFAPMAGFVSINLGTDTGCR
jgi:hypothetical protein